MRAFEGTLAFSILLWVWIFMYNKIAFKKGEDFSFDPFFVFFFPSVLCLLSCESDWSVAVILPKQGTNGIGLLDKSMQTDCILSVDRIMEGLHEVPHSFCYWLWRGFCTGVLFPLDKEVLWLVYLSHESTTKGNAKCVQCSVLNLTVVFVKFFLPHWSPAYFRKTYILFFSLILGLVDFHAFDPVKKLRVTVFLGFYCKASKLVQQCPL